jgi:predicted nucleic acid-binding protein
MQVFADSGYWIALLNPRDELHSKAVTVSQGLSAARIVTSEMVLAELLNSFCDSGKYVREKIASAVDAVRGNAQVTVVPQTSQQFEDALQLYKHARDKGWSFTDCASFNIMQDERVTAALTHDRHFEQAGYRALLR